jgi:hypothetical protein
MSRPHEEPLAFVKAANPAFVLWPPKRLRGARRSTQIIPIVLVPITCIWAFAGGSISGTVKDPSGAAIPRAKLTLVNSALKSEFKTVSDAQGFYSFPTLQVGHYDLTIEATGFQGQKKTNLTVDADAALSVDTVLQVVGGDGNRNCGRRLNAG